MDLAQIYRRHDKDKEDFNALRDKTWADMKQKHENLIAAFQSKDNLPKEHSKQIDMELDEFRKIWAIPHGSHYKALDALHRDQLKKAMADLIPANDRTTPPSRQQTSYEDSLASTRQKKLSMQRVKQPEKFEDLDQNKDSMELGYG
ncbi:hypothetical protein [Pedobacter sp. MC2016-24]|uniref:hypothetical protein n=1 Tax=Pedobacter sp. MC2016-24 TaxID=2780090 RepID=UPI00187FB84D|nr:hypothetical protein [Pedobacter sp. MC2016-24]MBE9602649.1 hypothetical protein [Pedobacter sp. MC2016-24]